MPGGKFLSIRTLFCSRIGRRLLPFHGRSHSIDQMNAQYSNGSHRGALIVFEGCDRSGKSTQCRLLAEYLRSKGKNIEELKFPDRTTSIGRTIDSYLQCQTELDDGAIHLLFSANRWEARPRIEKLIHSGTFVIVDRYAYSGVAFTAAKQHFELEWCKNPDKGLPQPDLVLYLDIPTKCAAERMDYGQERYEKAEFQERVALVYKQLKTDDWKVLDASQSIEDIQKQIRKIVDESAEVIKKPLGKLWCG